MLHTIYFHIDQLPDIMQEEKEAFFLFAVFFDHVKGPYDFFLKDILNYAAYDFEIKNSDFLSIFEKDSIFNQVTVPYNFDSFLLTGSSDSNYFGFLRGLDTDNHSVLSSMSSTRFIITGLDVLHSFTILSTGIKLMLLLGV